MSIDQATPGSEKAAARSDPPVVIVVPRDGDQVVILPSNAPAKTLAAQSVAPSVTEGQFLGLNEASATLLTGLLAGIIAVLAIATQRTLSVRQATLEFIRLSETNSDVMRARQTFAALTNSADDFGKFAGDEYAVSEEVAAIRLVLNELEMAAVAVGRGILDDTTYRHFWQSGVVRTWKYARSYVEKRRERAQAPRLYCNAEALAERYEQNLPAPRLTFWRKLF